eukprot:935528-Pleurochrysis_carterae.AAC.1
MHASCFQFACARGCLCGTLPCRKAHAWLHTRPRVVGCSIVASQAAGMAMMEAVDDRHEHATLGLKQARRDSDARA